MRKILSLILALSLISLGSGLAWAQGKPPYWASISAGKARMRTGPGRQFPASWLYQRADLPVKVIETYPNWRKIEDPDGTQGWIQSNLISLIRTAIIVKELRPLRQSPSAEAQIIWKAEPGVVGRISECGKGWCKFDVHGRMGYLESAHIWGVDPSVGK
jgi:SH3-like domain-containing protein